MIAGAEFFAAVFARLATDAGLLGYRHASMSAAGVPVFDRVPRADDPLVLAGTVKLPRPPYVVTGMQSETPFPIFGRRSSEDVVQIHVWDDYRGRARVLEILGLIDAALTSEALEVSGYAPIRMTTDFAQVPVDPSGWAHGVWQGRRRNL